MSKKLKGSLVVYDDRDERKINFRIYKNDPNYDPIHHIFYRTGLFHSEKTKQKIGRPGKIGITNGTNNRWIFNGEDIPTDYNFGISSNNLGTHEVNLWYYNPLTLEEKRFKSEEKVPAGWLTGRPSIKGRNNNGFNAANSLYNVVDLINRKSTKVKEIDYNTMGPQSGTSTERTIIYVTDNLIFTCKKHLLDQIPELKYIEKDKIIRKPHFNMSECVGIFHRKNEGLTYDELGYNMYPLELYTHKHEREIYWPTTKI